MGVTLSHVNSYYPYCRFLFSLFWRYRWLTSRNAVQWDMGSSHSLWILFYCWIMVLCKSIRRAWKTSFIHMETFSIWWVVRCLVLSLRNTSCCSIYISILVLGTRWSDLFSWCCNIGDFCLMYIFICLGMLSYWQSKFYNIIKPFTYFVINYLYLSILVLV